MQPTLVDNVDNNSPVMPNIRPVLDVITFVSLVQRGMTQAQIAKLYKRSPQAINQFKDRNASEIYKLLQPQSYLALKFQLEALHALDSISEKDRTQASYLQKATVAGIAIDKYRLLSSQSTANVDLHLYAKLEEELKSLLSQD